MINHFENIIEEFQKILKFEVDNEIKENTPKRIADMYVNELLIGYTQNPKEILSKRFKTKNNNIIIVKDIPFFSTCEHHFLPFYGKCDFGYMPKNYEIVGLSKVPRLINCFSRRLQTQEFLVDQIINSFFEIVKPEGCMLIMTAEHMCAQIRGVQATGTKMTTSSLRGCFEKPDIKAEFLQLIK